VAMTSTNPEAEDPAGTDARVCIVGGFDLHVDRARVRVPLAVQKLLAFLALHVRPLTRTFVAGSLWPDTTEERAAASLRATLWRTPAPGIDLVTCTVTQLALASGVEVDHHEAVERARQLIEPPLDHEPTTLEGEQSNRFDESLFGADLLPGWNDEWVIVERERLRQLRLHALESICHRYLLAGDTARAIDVGMQAVAADPLRESAQRALVAAHLSEGNIGEALNTFDTYRDRLADVLGLGASPLMHALVAPYLASRAAAVPFAGRANGAAGAVGSS
jgi:DNA-binding SARP family transcriptional activator